jgi:hypothetical protein
MADLETMMQTSLTEKMLGARRRNECKSGRVEHRDEQQGAHDGRNGRASDTVLLQFQI